MAANLNSLLITAIALGLAATAALDLLAQILKHALNIQPTNWSMVGRWVGHIPGGRLQHDAIQEQAEIRYECILGWFTHYLIGIIYALIYLAITEAFSLPVSIGNGLLFGLITLLAPWLILQPGLGLGYFASRSPWPNKTRIMNIAMHLWFGAWLYLAAMIFSG